MTEQPQTSGSDAPSPAPEPETDVVERREPEEPRKFDPPKDRDGTGRFAGYDTTLGRFVDGGVHDSRKAAEKAAKESGAASYRVVEV